MPDPKIHRYPSTHTREHIYIYIFRTSHVCTVHTTLRIEFRNSCALSAHIQARRFSRHAQSRAWRTEFTAGA